MPFAALPATAAWRHQGARSGFEVVYFHPVDGGYCMRGCTTAVEDGQSWSVDYEIRLDRAWNTRSAQVAGRSVVGAQTMTLSGDGTGRWVVDDQAAPHLDGCFDVDLESSAMTNALPVHRMRLSVGDRASAPAAYVRALTLEVGRLEQSYHRATDEARTNATTTPRPRSTSSAG